MTFTVPNRLVQSPAFHATDLWTVSMDISSSSDVDCPQTAILLQVIRVSDGKITGFIDGEGCGHHSQTAYGSGTFYLKATNNGGNADVTVVQGGNY
jgi:hypothetical protein